MQCHDSIARGRATLSSVGGARPGGTSLLAQAAGFALATCFAAGSGAQAPPIIAAETFYVPIPENDVASVFRFLDVDARFDRIISVVSIANSIEGTIVVYDHHEDGFEANLANPTQDTTEIWGDGDVSNGDVCLVATDDECENDTLGNGDVILLRDEVKIDDAGQPVDEDPEVTRYDYNGSDKFIATKPIAVTRVAWAPDPGPDTLLAGAVELLPTSNWGMEFEAPVGEGQDSDQMLELTTASYMATAPDTTISFDNNGDGDALDVDLGEGSTTLGEGESFLVPLELPVLVGARVFSDKPIQAHAITGDIGSSWETRWANLPPASEFGAEYYVPVSTRLGDRPGDTADPTDVFVYNPRSQNDDSIIVECQALAPCLDRDNLIQESVEVPVGESRRFRLPQFSADGTRETGARLTSTGGESFYAIALVDANSQTDDTDSSDDSNANNRDHDWGIALAPLSQLSPQALVGFAPSIDPEDCAPGEPFDCSPPAAGGDGSPLWIMVARDPDGDPDNPDDLPGVPTTVIIDHDGDPNAGSQREVELLPLERVRVFDNDTVLGEGDNDNTGTIVYTLDGTPVVVAWGQDPSSSVRGRPYFDAGTIVPAVPLFQIVKGVDETLVMPGATLTYTVILSNVSEALLLDFEVTDVLPEGVTYVAGSLQVDDADFMDEGFPVDGALLFDELDSRSDVFITFQVTVNDDVVPSDVAVDGCLAGETRLLNVVTARQATYEFGDSAQTCVEFPPPEIDIQKEIEGPDTRTIDKFSDVDFAITVTNTGTVDLEQVVVTDVVSPQCDNAIGDMAAGASVTYSCTVPLVMEPFDNEACVVGVSSRGEEAGDCDESSVVLNEPPLGLGCSVSSWLDPGVFIMARPGIDFDTTFNETFGRDDFGRATLYQALGLKTPRRGLRGLAAQAAAAVLNATADTIDYGLTVSQVVALFNGAVDNGDSAQQTALRKFLRKLNRRFCPQGC